MISLVGRVLVLFVVCALLVEGAPRPKRKPAKLVVDSKELKALDYLQKYGYFSGNTKTKMSFTDKKSAIIQFQKTAGLKPTGLIDSNTLEKMDQPRCGNADNLKKYRTVGRWPKKDLTYTISKYPASTLSQQHVDQEIARAFQVWSDYTDLTFRVADRRRDQRPDIDIKFEKGNHGDGSSFDGPGGTLAHAFFPTDGKAHFDDTERWTMHDYQGINLFQVAAHEFGHSLGLDHSQVSAALMAPFYQTYQPNFKLHEDDQQGIQRLYGQKTNQRPPAPPPNPPPRTPAPPTNPGRPNPEWPFYPRPTDPNLCQDLTFDTIFTDLQGVTYVIKGTQYWVLGSNTPPQQVQSKWPGLPSRIDAAFSHQQIGKTYFFSGAHFWRYQGDSLDLGYPKRIAESFRGIPDDIDAAFVWSRNNQIYFFKGSEYWKYDYTTLPAVDRKYPQQIINWWRVVPDAPDAAFSINGVTYFAKGSYYAQFMDATLTVRESTYVPLHYPWFYQLFMDQGQDIEFHQRRPTVLLIAVLGPHGYQSIANLFGCPNSLRKITSNKDRIWMAGVKKRAQKLTTKTKSRLRSHFVESLNAPAHKSCTKHHMCRRFP